MQMFSTTAAVEGVGRCACVVVVVGWWWRGGGLLWNLRACPSGRQMWHGDPQDLAVVGLACCGCLPLRLGGGGRRERSR